MGDSIDDLIEEVIVDAYGPDEQLWAFRQAFEDTAHFPFSGQVVGVDVRPRNGSAHQGIPSMGGG